MNNSTTILTTETVPTGGNNHVGSGVLLGDPVAWMRRWYFEKEKEYKVLNPKTGRMGLHNKFKWLPVTLCKHADDDIPLYLPPNAGAEAPATDDVAQLKTLW